jgi:hypothetical protein
MKIYLGIDDTDNHSAPYGTGKLVRWLADGLSGEYCAAGVVRQQLLVDPRIPYTSHNSSACLLVDIAHPALLDRLIATAVEHLERYALEGSDPGLCVAYAHVPGLASLIEFGYRSTRNVLSQKEALHAAGKFHLSGHGGTNDGIIGAAAAVGLTASGWCGRFIEFGNLREFPPTVRVGSLTQKNIDVISIDRDAKIPDPDDVVITRGWVRPRLLGHRAVMMVKPKGLGLWQNIDAKRQKCQTPMNVRGQAPSKISKNRAARQPENLILDSDGY